MSKDYTPEEFATANARVAAAREKMHLRLDACVCGVTHGVPHFCIGDPDRNGKAVAWEHK